MNKRDMLSLIVSLAGLLIIILSIGADFFQIGKSQGLGRYQVMDCAAGAITLIAGVLFMPYCRQKLASRKAGVCLLIFGAVFLLLSVFADPLGAGMFPGFGIIQIVGLLLGACAMIFGGMQLRSKNMPEPEKSDNNL